MTWSASYGAIYQQPIGSFGVKQALGLFGFPRIGRTKAYLDYPLLAQPWAIGFAASLYPSILLNTIQTELGIAYLTGQALIAYAYAVGLNTYYNQEYASLAVPVALAISVGLNAKSTSYKKPQPPGSFVQTAPNELELWQPDNSAESVYLRHAALNIPPSLLLNASLIIQKQNAISIEYPGLIGDISISLIQAFMANSSTKGAVAINKTWIFGFSRLENASRKTFLAFQA